MHNHQELLGKCLVLLGISSLRVVKLSLGTLITKTRLVVASYAWMNSRKEETSPKSTANIGTSSTLIASRIGSKQTQDARCAKRK